MVCDHPTRDLASLLPLLAGAASEQGGVLSSFATLCRELRVPYVAGVRGLMSRVDDGWLVTLDGTSGSVQVSPARRSVEGHDRATLQ